MAMINQIFSRFTMAPISFQRFDFISINFLQSCLVLTTICNLSMNLHQIKKKA